MFSCIIICSPPRTADNLCSPMCQRLHTMAYISPTMLGIYMIYGSWYCPHFTYHGVNRKAFQGLITLTVFLLTSPWSRVFHVDVCYTNLTKYGPEQTVKRLLKPETVQQNNIKYVHDIKMCQWSRDYTRCMHI